MLQIFICNLLSLIQSALQPLNSQIDAIQSSSALLQVNDLFRPRLVHGCPKPGMDGSVASSIANWHFYKLINDLFLLWLELKSSSSRCLWRHHLALSYCLVLFFSLETFGDSKQKITKGSNKIKNKN